MGLVIIGNRVYARGPRRIYKEVRSVKKSIENITNDLIELRRISNGQYVFELD